MDTSLLLAALVGLVIGAAVTWLLTRTDGALARAEAADARAALAAATARLEGARATASAAQERAEQLAADREDLATHFKLLSQDVLDAHGARSEATAAERLQATERLLAPMTEALQHFQDRLTQVEKERVALHAELRGEVRAVQQAGLELRHETSALVNALRKPQARGAWGETQLRRLVEIAGMQARCDFDEQPSFTTTEGTLRPDMVIHLAEGREIFVDAKVPLSAWLDAGDTDDETQRAAFLATFARHVRTHVDQLGGKQYHRLTATESPEFVVLFLPGENFLQAALEGQPDLYEHAFRRGVVIATPNTLVALLRTVALGWRQTALTASAREVLHLGRELHERLGSLGGNVASLGKALERSVQAYNETVGSLERRVLVSARRFTDLAVTDVDLESPAPLDAQVRDLRAPELLGGTGPAVADGDAAN